ncbi:MAG TPA: GTP 3',8-cyclase MoaA [Candidatus Saccharimonadales bacterium]|nr:GTP 3',8-cyclase MoaA [Candidatus Saccharimonadales bacterium]
MDQAETEHSESRLMDSFGRAIRSLRVSVTDRCNFRCTYCMPPEGIELLPAAHFLTYAETARLVRILCSLGVRKVRLTGGEPLLRRDLEDLVTLIRPTPGLEDISLTTNGYYLADRAASLWAAGLRRINVSLDSLDKHQFHRITRVNAYDRVWSGIEAALAVGMRVKLNAVVLRETPLEQLVAFAGLAKEGRLEARFIEFMPLCGHGWTPEKVLPIAEVREAVRKAYRLEANGRPRGSDVAETYRVEGGNYVGFIGSLTEPFCENCDRVRLGVDGRLQLCLFNNQMLELGPMVRGGSTDVEIREYLLKGVLLKPAGHGFRWDDPRNAMRPNIRTIGG